MKYPIRLIVALLCTVVTAGALPEARPQEGPQTSGRSEGTPVLWRDPGAIATKDLYWGIGSPDQAPQPPFTFIEEDARGTKPKVTLRDARGMTWNVKFVGPKLSKNEVHAEIAATWALGYLAEENYYFPEGKIEGVGGKLVQAASSIAPDGTFRVARFERRPPDVVRTGRRWSFDKNPFRHTKELSGLKILTTLLNSWDIKSSNTEVFQVRGENGRLEDWYLFTDLGSTFGRMDHHMALFSKRSRWNVQDYQEQAFIDGVRNGKLDLHYKGAPPIDIVPVEDARWFTGLATQLTTNQVRRAFEAAGASAAEIEGFSARVMEKIQELRRAVEEPEKGN